MDEALREHSEYVQAKLGERCLRADIAFGELTITVRRQSPDDVRQRQLIVSLDGGKWVTLMYGQSATREVPAGRHAVKVYNTLVWRTHELTLAEGEHVSLSVVNRATFGTYALVSLLGVGPLYVTIDRDPGRSDVAHGAPDR